MIDYCTKMPEKEEYEKGHKYPYYSCEILCSMNGLNIEKLLHTHIEDNDSDNIEKEEDNSIDDEKREKMKKIKKIVKLMKKVNIRKSRKWREWKFWKKEYLEEPEKNEKEEKKENRDKTEKQKKKMI